MPASLRQSLFSVLVLLTIVADAPHAIAHPMGNFSINHYSKVEVEQNGVAIQYVLDLAEIPTFQELQDGNISATAETSAMDRYIAKRGTQLGRGLILSLDGKAMPVRLVSSNVIFPVGAGGLPTMKMGFTFEAPYPTGSGVDISKGLAGTLRFADQNYPGHSGWKEIIAVASYRTLTASSVPTTDRSSGLSNYPVDLLNSPPQVLEASMDIGLPLHVSASSSQIAAVRAITQHKEAPGRIQATVTTAHAYNAKTATRMVSNVEDAGIVLSRLQTEQPKPLLKANRKKTPRDQFTELIVSQQLGAWFLLTAAFIAAGLGALHALEPGHGKTIVAAYLVGSRGTARHAVLLGLVVTVSHTAGVFALGAVTLYASRYIVPEQLYPWLGVLSGLTIAVLGIYMLMRRLTGAATDHSHVSGERHFHFSFLRRNADGNADVVSTGIDSGSATSVSLTQLFTLGITGGIIPCPAALIVLLSAFALHRITLGFFLIVAFSVGLAAVLIGFGMAMVYARRFLSRFQGDGPIILRWLPVFSSVFITILGTVVAVQAFATTTLSAPLWANMTWFSKEKLGPLLFVIGLGLILGMRHSTDADHVVAISTIVSKQRSIRGAALIGSVWGLGHTITIFVVGALIILFSVQIPVRVGLSMEFSVAVMLVILGLLNLSGLMQKITSRFTPSYTPVRVDAEVFVTSATRSIGKIVRSLGLYQCIRPLVIGLVHGLAGSAAVALLVLSTIHDPRWATLYLLIFGVGTMAGMMCMTTAMAVPLRYAGNRFGQLSRYLGAMSGIVSVCFGSFLIYQLGFLGGLFTSHPQWTPR